MIVCSATLHNADVKRLAVSQLMLYGEWSMEYGIEACMYDEHETPCQCVAVEPRYSGHSTRQSHLFITAT